MDSNNEIYTSLDTDIHTGVEYVTIEIKITTRSILSKEGIKELHNDYFDSVKRVLEDLRKQAWHYRNQ